MLVPDTEHGRHASTHLYDTALNWRSRHITMGGGPILDPVDDVGGQEVPGPGAGLGDRALDVIHRETICDRHLELLIVQFNRTNFR